jgi:hypothetical protein
VEAAGDAEVEIRAIGKDGGGRAEALGFGYEFSVLAVDAGDVVEDLDDADDGEAGHVHDGADAGGFHALAGAAEQFDVAELSAEGIGETGGVAVARGFAGRNQDARRHSYSVYRCLAGGLVD